MKIKQNTGQQPVTPRPNLGAALTSLHFCTSAELQVSEVRVQNIPGCQSKVLSMVIGTQRDPKGAIGEHEHNVAFIDFALRLFYLGAFGWSVVPAPALPVL